MPENPAPMMITLKGRKFSITSSLMLRPEESGSWITEGPFWIGELSSKDAAGMAMKDPDRRVCGEKEKFELD